MPPVAVNPPGGLPCRGPPLPRFFPAEVLPCRGPLLPRSSPAHAPSSCPGFSSRRSVRRALHRRASPPLHRPPPRPSTANTTGCISLHNQLHWHIQPFESANTTGCIGLHALSYRAMRLIVSGHAPYRIRPCALSYLPKPLTLPVNHSNTFSQYPQHFRHTLYRVSANPSIEALSHSP